MPALLRIEINDFYGYTVGFQHGGKRRSCPSRADDDGFFDVPGTAFRHTPAEFFYIFRRADEVSVVVREQAVIAVGDNHLMITENHSGKDFIRQFQIFERYMDIRRLALYPCLIQTDAAIGEISHVKGGGRHEDAPYFFCRDQLRTQNQVNVKIFLEIFGGFLKEFRVADAGNRVGDSVFLCQHGSKNIHLIHFGHRHENRCIPYIGIPCEIRTCPVGGDREHIQRVADFG